MSKNNKGIAKTKGWSAEDYETPGTKADEIEEIKEAFDLFDNDLSGAISVSELTSSFKSLGFDVAHSNVFEILKDLDKDGNGEIDFTEFVDLMTAKLSSENSREEIEKVFKMFDQDRTGEISVGNLAKVASTLGDDISNENLQSVINVSDVDGDGRLTFEDFYAIMTRASVEDRAALRQQAEAQKPAKVEVPKTKTPPPEKVERPKTPVAVERPKTPVAVERPKTPVANKVKPDTPFAKRFSSAPEQYRFQMIGRYMSSNKWADMTFKKILMEDSGDMSGRGADGMGFWGFTGKIRNAPKNDDGTYADHMLMSLYKEYKGGPNVEIEGEFNPVQCLMDGNWWPEKTPEKKGKCQIKMGAPIWNGSWTGAPIEFLGLVFAIEDGRIIGQGVGGDADFDGDDYYHLNGEIDFETEMADFVQTFPETGETYTFNGKFQVDGADDIINGTWKDAAGKGGDFEVRYKHRSGFIDW